MSWFGPPSVPDSVPSPDTARTLVLYKYDTCGYCLRVMRAIQSLGIQGIELRDTVTDPSARRALLDMNGTTQVPCLVIDGHPLLESSDIVAWLQAYSERA